MKQAGQRQEAYQDEHNIKTQIISENEEEIKGRLKTHARNNDYKDVKEVSNTLKNIEKTLKAGHEDIK